MTARALSPAERDAFVTSLEQEFGWAEVTSGWSRHTTAEARAEDREQWLIDVAVQLTQRAAARQPVADPFGDY